MGQQPDKASNYTHRNTWKWSRVLSSFGIAPSRENELKQSALESQIIIRIHKQFQAASTDILEGGSLS